MSAPDLERLEEAHRLAEIEERGFVLLATLSLLVGIFSAGAAAWTWVAVCILVGGLSMFLAFVVALGADDLRRQIADERDRA